MSNYLPVIEVVERFSGWSVCKLTNTPVDYIEWCKTHAGNWTILGPLIVAFQDSGDALAFKLRYGI